MAGKNKRKARKARARAQAAPPPPPGKAREARQWPRAARGAVVAAAVAVVVALVYTLEQRAQTPVVYSFSRVAADDWNLQASHPQAVHWEWNDDSLSVEIDKEKAAGAYGVVSGPGQDARNRLAVVTWQDYPYVRIAVEPQARDRTIMLVWNTKGISQQVARAGIPAHAGEIIINTHSEARWQGKASWDISAGISGLNLIAADSMTLHSVSLEMTLPLPDLLAAAWREYMAIEPITTYSINFRAHSRVLGFSLVVALGVLVLLSGLALALTRTRRSAVVFCCVASAAYVALDIPFMGSLFAHARLAHEVSAWHADRYDEYASRFDEEFAQLDRALREHAPAGAKVAFPWSRKRFFPGESNWLEFLYRDHEYATVGPYPGQQTGSEWIGDDIEYLFYYYPEGLSVEADGETVSVGGSGKKYRVETLYQSSPGARLLKVVR
ncbi:MAG: hypothetical protein OXU34_02105 [Gammaproteobacteria bacterium]|nr:hypothetical protein [Gammaproteobacteria bacterium]